MNESCFWKIMCTLPTSKKEFDVMESLMERDVYTRRCQCPPIFPQPTIEVSCGFLCPSSWGSPGVLGSKCPQKWPILDKGQETIDKDPISLTLSGTARYGSTRSLGGPQLPSVIVLLLPQFLLAFLLSLSHILLFHVLLPGIISKPLVPSSLLQHLLLGGGNPNPTGHHNWYLIHF